ncbi:MAG: ATP-binding protein [Lachnospiraceae bacterium]|nr:ATP-binding protein [Lachnospiraceae bacterium]
MFRRNGEWDIISMVKDRIRNIRLFKSLGLRIFVIICAVGIIPGVILRNILLNSYETRAISVKVSEIQNQCTILANHLVTYGYLVDQTSEVVNAELEQFSSLYDGRIMIIDGDLKIIKDTYSISQGKIMISEEILKCFDKASISKHDKNNHYLEFTTPITDSQSGDVIGVILTSVSTDNIAETIKIMGRRAYLFEIIVGVVTVCFSIFVTIFLIKPFRAVNTAIIQVEEGFTEEKISVPVYNETRAISDSFNRLMDKMNTLEASRQEFVANVSHELKTPITSMKVLADSLISQEDVPVEIYREFMKDISSEIDREDKIINNLLSLVKLDRTTVDRMDISIVDINKMLEDILKRVRPIADKTKVDLILESIRPVSAEIDEIKLSLAIMNVIENAIKYNKENGWVKVTVDSDHQFFTVVVSDNGMGIPEDALAHIYERFYRVDKSHSREIGGTGLGLAITRNAILMHDGAIKVESTEGVGTSFTIKVPKTHKVSAKQNTEQPVKAKFKWRFLSTPAKIRVSAEDKNDNDGKTDDKNKK